MAEFLFNPTRLSFHIPHMLGGILLCGDKGEHGRGGNGDCIVVDGTTGLIGVADGTERSPQASRRFLKDTAAHLSDMGRRNARPSHTDLLKAAQSVLDSFRYEDRTTFLCILPASDGSVFYLSGGDSILMHIDTTTSRVLFRNRSNMGFAGRSPDLLDFGHLQVKRGERLLLATDGLWDIQREDSQGFLQSILSIVSAGPLHLVPTQLITAVHPAFCTTEARSYDDFSLVLIDPLQIRPFSYRVLLGGTDKDSEHSYQRRCKSREFPDRDCALPEDGHSLWIFPDCLDEYSC